MSAEKPTIQEFAALAYALALTRGQLNAVMNGDFDLDQVRGILEGTAALNIARELGLKEADLTVDWDDHLSDSAKAHIRGAHDD